MPRGDGTGPSGKGQGNAGQGAGGRIGAGRPGGCRAQGGAGRGLGLGGGRGAGHGGGRAGNASTPTNQMNAQNAAGGDTSRPADAARNQNETGAHMHNIIAVTSEGPALTDMVDPRFGRAAGFVVVNLATGATSYVDNGGSQVMSQGAGIQAAENVAGAGVQVVLSGFVGPKAFTALSAAGIAVVQDVENMTVAQAVERYKSGELVPAAAANAQSGGNKPGASR
ncbi:NifB/NifX family molybdenum-iron cluster-binding protein [Humidesulfovibrio sp.]